MTTLTNQLRDQCARCLYSGDETIPIPVQDYAKQQFLSLDEVQQRIVFGRAVELGYICALAAVKRHEARLLHAIDMAF